MSSADFNGDGVVDLVAGNYHANTLSVLLGQISSVATATTTGIAPAGTTGSFHQVSATYPGDSLYAGSTSAMVTLSASPVLTSLTLSVQPDNSAYGQQVALTAVLAPYTAQSSSTNGELISFYNGTQLLGTAPLSSGVATLNLTSLPIGPSALRAVYAADATFAGSTSATLAHTVLQPTATLTVAPLSLPYGTVTATLTAQLAYTAMVAPTGAVSFGVDSGAPVAAMCTGSASPRVCTATYSIASLASGTHTITATQTASPGPAIVGAAFR